MRFYIAIVAGYIGVIGSRKGTSPCAPTEPDVTVSRHPAPVIDRSRRVQISQCANRLGSALCILLNHSYA